MWGNYKIEKSKKEKNQGKKIFWAAQIFQQNFLEKNSK